MLVCMYMCGGCECVRIDVYMYMYCSNYYVHVYVVRVQMLFPHAFVYAKAMCDKERNIIYVRLLRHFRPFVKPSNT